MNNKRKVDDIPLGTGMLDKVRSTMLERRKKQQEQMNKGGSKRKEPKDNN